MKKLILLLSIILCLLTFISCTGKNSPGEIEINIGQSVKFTNEEINRAVEYVKKNFSFPDSSLKKIWYDEEKCNYLTELYMVNGRGSINGVLSENVLILLTEFYVNGSGNNPVLNKNTTYSDYQWILIRDDKDSNWIVDDRGY